MTLETCNLVTDLVCDFLHRQGGVYRQITGRLQENIIMCLVSGQYSIKIRDGEIKHFCCWFRIKPEDVEGMMERVRPVDIFGGSVVYVAELGNTEGRRGMVEIISTIRRKNHDCKGVFWHRTAKDFKVYHYPSQKGVNHG